MSRRSFQVATWTTAATADGADLPDNNHQSVRASSTTGLNVVEIYVGGQATATLVNIMQFARAGSQVGTGTLAIGAAGNDGPIKTLSPPTLVGATMYTTAATLKPRRTSTATSARLNLTLNAFGGIVRWFANPGEEWGIVGATADISESNLSAFTGSSAAAIGSHIIHEVL